MILVEGNKDHFEFETDILIQETSFQYFISIQNLVVILHSRLEWFSNFRKRFFKGTFSPSDNCFLFQYCNGQLCRNSKI